MEQAAIDFLLNANLEFLEIWQNAKEHHTKEEESFKEASEKLLEKLSGVIGDKKWTLAWSGEKSITMFKRKLKPGEKVEFKELETSLESNENFLIFPFTFWSVFFAYKDPENQRDTIFPALVNEFYGKNDNSIADDLKNIAASSVIEHWLQNIPQLSKYATQCWALFEALMDLKDNNFKDVNDNILFIRKNNFRENGENVNNGIDIAGIKNILPFIRPDLKFYFDKNKNVTSIIRSEEMEMNNTIKLLEGSKQIILTGAPGTGKTYHATKVAEEMIKKSEGGEYKKVQFHPGYDYSDFIIGLKPEVKCGQVTFNWKDGVFKAFAQKAYYEYKKAEEQAQKTKDKEINAKPYIFIIDEINRADLSRVFGEVFSLLEEDYRYPNKEKGITLPNKKDFILPRNLYIIGTMNDIDRSVESMDFALRRRFSWKEVTAESSASIIYAKGEDGNFKIANENDRAALQRAMNELNIYIGGEEEAKKKERLKIKEQPVSLNLGGEYKLGGAYFLNFAKYQDDKSKDQSAAFESLWNNHIAIILNEYLRGKSNRQDIVSALKGKYNDAWQGKTKTPDTAATDTVQQKQEQGNEVEQ